MNETTAQHDTLPEPVRRVAEALAAAGLPAEIRIVAESTHTVEEAASVLRVEPRQIVKSMVFRGEAADRLVLVVLAGDRQVDLAKLAAELGEKVVRADADWVRERTGFAIGGIPPLAHATPATVVVDASIPGGEDLYAGAGTSRALFRTTGHELREAAGGTVADVARAS